MLRYLPLVVAIAIVVWVKRVIAARCREEPHRRLAFIFVSVAALGLAGLLVPWVLAKLNPPFSESPAGIFVILGKVAVVGSIALAGLGGLIGALMPGSSDDAPEQSGS